VVRQAERILAAISRREERGPVREGYMSIRGTVGRERVEEGWGSSEASAMRDWTWLFCWRISERSEEGSLGGDWRREERAGVGWRVDVAIGGREVRGGDSNLERRSYRLYIDIFEERTRN
jgi:hypothetical protein